MIIKKIKNTDRIISPHIHHTHVKRNLILGALILLITALFFNALLTISSLEKLYVESIVSKYCLIGKDLQRNLEKSLKYGKNIQKFIGIDLLLTETKKNILKKSNIGKQTNKMSESLTGIIISISLPKGTILYSSDDKKINTKIPKHIVTFFNDVNHKKQFIKYEKNYYIILPVHGGFHKKTVANILIMFSEKQVKDLLKQVFISNIKTIFIIITAGFILMLILLNFVFNNAGNKFPKAKISIIMFLIIGISQIVFTGLNTNMFKNYYLDISKEKTDLLTVFLKDDIEYLLNKGLSINKLYKMEEKLGEIIAATPELDNITISDKYGEPLYTANHEEIIDFQKAGKEKFKSFKEKKISLDPKYNILKMIVKDKKLEGFISADNYQGFINTNISKKVLFARLKEITLDSATVLVVSFLFLIEISTIMFQVIKKQSKVMISIDYKAIRPAAFLFLFAAFISSSFLPLHTANLYKGSIFGMSKDVILGLPISAEMLFAGIAIIFSGIIVDKKGWHTAFFIGIFFSTIGIFLSGTAQDVIPFILYRGIMGFGYGLTWLSFQGFIVEHTDESQRAQGISLLVAGIFSGSICGGAVGGMLAERIGYSQVFFVGAGIMLFSMLFVIIFMQNSFVKSHTVQKDKKKFSIRLLFRFIFDRNIFLLLICCSIPNSLCFVGIMYYFTPIYLNSINILPSNIARALMIYGLSMIYLAPVFSQIIDKSDNKKLFIVLGGFIGGTGLLSFYILDGFIATITVIFMLSIANCFGLASRLVFAMNTKIVQELGKGMSLGLYLSLERVGQVLGPMILALAVSITGLTNAIVIMGIIYLIITLFFLVCAQAENLRVQTIKTGGL